MKKILIILTIICGAISLNAQQKISQYTRTDSLKGSSVPYKPDSALLDVSVWNFAGSYSTRAITWKALKTLIFAGDTSHLSTLGDTGWGNYRLKGTFINDNGNNHIYNQPILTYPNFCGSVLMDGSQWFVNGVTQKTDDTTSEITYKDGAIINSFSVHRGYMSAQYTGSAGAAHANKIRLVSDSIKINMHGILSTVWDTTGKFWCKQPVEMDSTVTITDNLSVSGSYLSDLSFNSKFGTDAGLNNTGYFNVLLGQNAGKLNQGSRNNFIGYAAGAIHLTGDNNLFIGLNSGALNEYGSDNVFLGHNSGYSETGSNKLYISNSVTTSPLIYGNFKATGAEPFRVGTNGRFFIKDTLFIGGTFTAPDDTITGTISFIDYVGNIGNSTTPNDTGFFKVISGGLQDSVIIDGVLLQRTGSFSNDTLDSFGHNKWRYDGTTADTLTTVLNEKIDALYIIKGGSDTNTLLIPDGSVFHLSGSVNFTLGLYDVLVLECVAENVFVEHSRSDN